MTPERDPRVEKALGATTEDTPQGLQYVLIRGLHAMGYAQPVLESEDLMAAALKAADAAGWQPMPDDIADAAPFDGEDWLTAREGSIIPFVASWDEEEGWTTFNRCYETTIQPHKGIPWRPTHYRSLQSLSLPSAPGDE